MRILCAAVLVAVSISGPAHAADAKPNPRFHSAQYDSPGKDTRSADSLNAEWISLVNADSKPISLKGWTVREAGGRTYTFGAATITTTLRLHTGAGTDTATDKYWNSGNYVWNNTGDTATLRNSAGRVVDTCEWSQQADRTVVGC